MSREGFHKELAINQMVAAYPNELFVRAFESICQGTEITVKGEKTFELQPMISVLEQPQKRVLTIPYRRLNPFFLLAESLWLLAGKSDAGFITYFNPRLNEYLDEGEFVRRDGSIGNNFHGAYGQRLMESPGRRSKYINQLEQCYKRLKADLNSRQAVMTIWNPSRDNTEIETKDTPCNIAISFKVRDGKLNMSVFNRSNDFVWGYCSTNIVQFSVIQEVLAGYLGVEIGRYIQYSDSMHVYESNPYYKAYHQPNSKVKAAAHYHHVWNKYDIYKSVKPLPIKSESPEEFEADVQKTYDIIDRLITGKDVEIYSVKNEYLKLTKEALSTWMLIQDGYFLEATENIRDMVLCDWKVEIIRYMYTHLMRQGWEQGNIVDELGIEQLPIVAATYVMHDDGEALI